MKTVRFIDLFAGIGGLRLGFENGFKKSGIKTECVMTSEIKPYAIKTLKDNFKDGNIVGDISKVSNDEIPDFDFLLAGFPCQPFSFGGKRHGFVDTRGTLFFEIERIISAKKPYGFILENVEGLVKHDLEKKSDKTGRTLNTIIEKLKTLGYNVNWDILNAADFGLPQERKRVFIVGTLNGIVNLDGFKKRKKHLNEIMETGLPTMNTKFSKLLLSHYNLIDLFGKSIKDKRGGSDNIHSWDIELKGKVSKEQKEILNKLFKERRKKHWAEKIGIDWMDGMSLTLEQIMTFHKSKNLKSLLDDLVKKGYLAFEHPKTLVKEVTPLGIKSFRVENTKLKKGYNIVTGKLSFEINKILDPNGISPTLVATDMEKLVIPDTDGIRRITLREGLRLFGYPEKFTLNVSTREGYDLLGNTVAVNVVNDISERLAKVYKEEVMTKKEKKNQTKGLPVASL